MAVFQNPFARRRLFPPPPILGNPMGQPPQPMDEVPRPLDRQPNMEALPRLPVSAPPQQDDGSDYFDEMMRVRGNRPAAEQYRKTLGEMPNRENYKPSGWRRLGAALVAGGTGFAEGPSRGVGMGEQVLDAPYTNAMKTYQPKLAAARTGAELEGQETNERMQILGDARKLGLSYADLMRKVEDDRRTRGTADFDASTRRITATRANYDFIETPQGVKLVDKTGQHEPIFMPGETVASAKLKVEQQNANAGTTRANAYRTWVGNEHQEAGADRSQRWDVAQLGAQVTMRGQDESTKRAEGSQSVARERIRSRAMEVFSDPRRADTAFDDNLRRLSSDPTFSKYIEQGPSDAEPYVIKPSTPAAIREAIMGEIEDLMDEEALSAGSRAGRR